MNETQLENLCLDWFRDPGWKTVYDPDISPGGNNQLRAEYSDIILYQSHKGYGGNSGSTRAFYQDYEKENASIDQSYDDDSMTEFVKQFRPSEVLFKMDKDAYWAAVDDIRNEEAV